MFEIVPYWCRIALLLLLMSLVAAIDWLRSRQKATKWEEYGFIFVSGGVGWIIRDISRLRREDAGPVSGRAGEQGQS